MKILKKLNRGIDDRILKGTEIKEKNVSASGGAEQLEERHEEKQIRRKAKERITEIMEQV